MHILFLFVDGIGLGEPSEHNPFSTARRPGFERLSVGQPWLAGAEAVDDPAHVYHPIDARLGVDGLPQSGTGQATLFTGVNCAHIVGRHYGPYPHSKTRPVIAEKNVFAQIGALDPEAVEPGAFANAYPDKFFEYVRKTDRWTVTTRCCLESSARIRGHADLQDGLAVPADLTGAGWPESIKKEWMPGDEREAARRLLRIASDHKLTLFEYYLTDKAGHKQSAEWADEVLGSLDALLVTLMDEIDREDVLLVLTSDHGNLEDLSTKTHTLNAVPFAAYGANAGLLRDVRGLQDVTPALVSLLADAG